MLPDALADVLGRVVADVQRQWLKEIDRMSAESRATIAECKLRVAEIENELREMYMREHNRLVNEMADAIDKVKDGKDGEPGLPGKDGKDGADGADGRDGAPGMDGRDGAPGVDGKDGTPGERGEKGIDGKDGRDGTDGAGFEDWTATVENERELVISCGKDERRKQIVLTLGYLIDRGVFKADQVYEQGDTVTHSGSLWIAQRQTARIIPGTSDDWRLAAKRGRDGKDGKDGAPGPQGSEGRAGRDLTQIGPNGGKW